MVHVNFNEYVSVKRNVPEVEVVKTLPEVVNPTRLFRRLLNENAEAFLRGQAQNSPARLAALDTVIETNIWEWTDPALLSAQDRTLLSTALGIGQHLLTPNWKTDLQSNVLGRTLNQSQGMCGEKASKHIHDRDGDANGDLFDEACEDYFTDNGFESGNPRRPRFPGYPASLYFPSMLAAVRDAENGPKDYEYGAGVGEDGYRNQVRSAAGTIEAIYQRYLNGWPPPDPPSTNEGYLDPRYAEPPHEPIEFRQDMEDFIRACANIYAPPHAHDLNKNWPKNVWQGFKDIYYC